MCDNENFFYAYFKVCLMRRAAVGVSRLRGEEAVGLKKGQP